jgi:phenylalanyl-tRNA synthetase alpha chain
MREEISNLKNEAMAQIVEVGDLNELDRIKISYLGRNGRLTDLIKKIKDLDADKKKETGMLLNEVKKNLMTTISDKRQDILSTSVSHKAWFDLSIPGERIEIGNLHAQTKVLTEILKIFNFLGYQVADGPEIETDYYNFTALNFPKDHPARDAQQTMFFDTAGTAAELGYYIPRTHTSAIQGRVMEKIQPPFRVIVPGRCFRYEQVDASHGVEFWQVEGFLVDKKVKFTDLLGTIEHVLKQLFGEKAKVRFAETYFPFVEPGLDAYLQCTVCSGKGCTFCKKSGWSEIMPAGMIHPNVLSMSKINPKIWNGFAFAIGLSRVVTLKYKISDLRVLNTPDVRILRQF